MRIYTYFLIRTEPEGIRTPDPRLRRPLLYPAELQTRRAGDGNRTHISSLEGWCSTTELHPQNIPWKISSPIGVTGFEPATSWSQTRRSSQAEPHPDILRHNILTYCHRFTTQELLYTKSQILSTVFWNFYWTVTFRFHHQGSNTS